MYACFGTVSMLGDLLSDSAVAGVHKHSVSRTFESDLSQLAYVQYPLTLVVTTLPWARQAGVMYPGECIIAWATLPWATRTLASGVFLTVPECKNLAMQKFST